MKKIVLMIILTNMFAIYAQEKSSSVALYEDIYDCTNT